MGGCTSTDKPENVVADGGAANEIEGCVSNSMVFLAR